MKYLKVPEGAAKLFPCGQLETTEILIKAFQDVIPQLVTALNTCPNIGEAVGLKEHPAVFHYTHSYNTDIYICEYDRRDTFYGFHIFGGNLEKASWNFLSLSKIISIPHIRFDFSFSTETIEAARYKKYPYYFKKPNSLM